MTDDDGLFQAWRSGDRAAGETLIERHFEAIERFFATKTQEGGDDLVQATFLRCLEAGESYRSDGSFRAFLFGIARNVLLEHIRSRGRHGGGPLDFTQSAIVDLSPGVATLVQYRAEQRHLVQALQRLPVELQLLIELYYWEELDVAELAVVLEIPAGTVKSRLHRARALLAEGIEAAPEAEDLENSVRKQLLEWLSATRAAAGR